MKKIAIVAAALILVSQIVGCGQTTTKKASPGPTTKGPQISSIATPNAISITMKQNLPVPAPMQPAQGTTPAPEGVGPAPAAPTPSAAPAGNSAGNTSQPDASSSLEQQVFQLVNQERAKAGLKAFVLDNKLSNAAMVKAKDMYDNNYFDHNSPTYGSPFDMMKKLGITFEYAGENIAKGQTTAQQVMTDWMNSEGHRANIMNGSFTTIGVAQYNGEWVQEFTG